MATPEGQWVLMATGRSPTNIAVIKYWGKRDEALILPVNDSISVTLDPDHLSATTTVAVSPSFPSDRMWLNGKVRHCDSASRVPPSSVVCSFIKSSPAFCCCMCYSWTLAEWQRKMIGLLIW
jgi:hypothetical protein